MTVLFSPPLPQQKLIGGCCNKINKRVSESVRVHLYVCPVSVCLSVLFLRACMIYNARKEVGEREKAVKREVRGKRCLKGKSADIP